MATTNPVQQILVTSGNQGLLAAGSRETALAVGQLGVFNRKTGLSVGAASPLGDTRDIYIAVGINKTGAGGGATLEDINRSAGQVIQVSRMKSYVLKGYTAAVQKIVDIDGLGSVRCETPYGIKVQFRNSKVYGLNGYNQFAKTYVATTGCCADNCTDCGTSDCAAMVTELARLINADLDALITASLYSMKIVATVTAAATANGNLTITIGTTVYTVAVLNGDTVTQVAAKIVAQINTQAASPYRASNVAGALTINAVKPVTGDTSTFTLTSAGGTGVTVGSITGATKTTVADGTAYGVAYPGACLGLRLTSNPLAVKSFTAGVNVDYQKLRTTDIVVSLINSMDSDGFNCSTGTVTTITEGANSDGEGYDVQWLEYMAGGWNGKPGPYRVSESTGLARNGFEYYAVKGTNYNMYCLTYDQRSVAGWLEHDNNLSTVIAIPCADATTLAGLAAVLDPIFTQFQPLANDAANTDCTNTEVHTINDVTLDGIQALS